MSKSNQAAHPLLMIPGPIEFSDRVLEAMAHPSMSHVGPPFVAVFGENLRLLRQIFLTKDPASQPFVISGSGSLGWDMVAVNLVEQGDDVLVLHTGYFGDSFADCFESYGVKATQLKAQVGARQSQEEIEQALKEKKYKMITITHTDTSTGVLQDVKSICATVKRVSPDTLICVDGVCSVACEEIQFDEWGVDVALTASQKAIGCPAGLAILMVSGRGMQAFANRKHPPQSYFASFNKWVPIMKAYENNEPKYFATPAVQLIYALNASLKEILERPMSARFDDHIKASDYVKNAITKLGLKQVAVKPEFAAHGMTAVMTPNEMPVGELLPKIGAQGVIFAGGLHKQIATKYFRIGHMGVSATDLARGDLDKALDALRNALVQVGYKPAEQSS
ncbi:hypothetical protein PYCC9005_004482 [Savitreella phatthalungensis]